MTRVFPNDISTEMVASLLREHSNAKPYTDDEWQTASFDFISLNIGINIRLENCTYGARERSRIELVIGLLPELHHDVIDVMTRDETTVGTDDHGLGWIDIDLHDGYVDLCYVGISYNTQWNQRFHIENDGTWTRFDGA